MRERWRLFLFDSSFFIYNLAYPALLGSFFYDLIFNPNKELRTNWDVFGKILIIAIFSLDFVWGRKFYEWIKDAQQIIEKPPTWKLFIFVFAEAIILWSLCHSFRAAYNDPSYYHGVAWFASAVLFMFFISDRKSYCSYSGGILLLLIVGGIAGPILVKTSGNPEGFRVCLATMAGALGVYYLSGNKEWQLKAISPSGSFIDHML